MSSKGKKSHRMNTHSEQEQIITAQYRYIKELAIMKYNAEEQREQNLVQQSSQMQTTFSFMTAAIFMVLPICIEYRGALSLTFFFISTSFISAFLIFSLITASLAQWRWKTESLPDVNVVKDSIINSVEWKSLCLESAQLAQYVNLIGKVQAVKAKLNDKRVNLIMASMICFYFFYCVYCNIVYCCNHYDAVRSYIPCQIKLNRLLHLHPIRRKV